MEQISEKLANYESSKTRRSLVDDSDCAGTDDKEYATSGFYVREKSNDKNSRTNSTSNSNDATEINMKGNQDQESNTSDANLANGEANEVIEETTEEDEVSKGSNGTEKDDDEVEAEKKVVEAENDSNGVESKEIDEDDKEVGAGENKDTEVIEDDKETGGEEKMDAEVVEDDKADEKNDSVEEVKEDDGKAEVEEKTEAEVIEDDKEAEVANEVDETDGKEEAKDVSTTDKVLESTIESKQKKEANLDDDKSMKNEETKEPTLSEDKNDTITPQNDEKEAEPEEKNEDKVEENTATTSDKKKDENPPDNSFSKHSSSTNTGTDYEDEDDFDPSLLCPDISMDVDEAPVLTNSQPPPPQADGSLSPLPYEPIFSTLVDEYTGTEIQVDLTPEEMELRANMYKPGNPVQSTKIHCTACNVHLGSALTGANNRFVHPLLKVLICKNCYHFYTSGEFEKDEDGSELYCRWCGQGGQVLCCSSCEFVFCKRCIRNNFGPKKFKQIRESDDWNCFRCEPGQLSYLRAACAEFIDYYKKESVRAQALATTNPELLTTDYTKCCSKEKSEEPKAPQRTRKRRNNEDSDPDYSVSDGGEPSSKRQALSSGNTPSTLNQLRALAPKPGTSTASPIMAPLPMATKMILKPQTGPRTNTFTGRPLGTNSILRNVTPGFIPRPGTSAAPPGYSKMVLQPRQPRPMGIQQPRPSYTVVSGATNGRPTFTSVRPTKVANQMPPMKHEWFEKTVRAAARVNSNLSYTLTQLNRQQSQATSVESLAVVHNKLQEVLSTSINSLIQVRKNLRTEFLIGIKSVKLPSKTAKPPTAAPAPPPAAADDDDVIFVSQPPPLILSPSISLTNKKIIPKPTTNNNINNKTKSGLTVKPAPSTTVKPTPPKPTPSTSKPATPISNVNKTTPSASIGGPVKGGGFLKVRSLLALQSVPSECITIPDDPVEDPLKLTLPQMPPQEPEQIEILDDEPEKNENSSPKLPSSPPPLARLSTRSSSSSLDTKMTYNVTEVPSPEVRRMMKAHVPLTKSPSLEQLLQKGSKHVDS